MSRTVRIIARRRVTWNTDQGLLDRLGSALRMLAMRIDGRISLAIEIHTIPRVPPKQLAACISRAMDDMGRYIKIEHEAEVENAALRKIHPELFENAVFYSAD